VVCVSGAITMTLQPEHALFVYLWEAAMFTLWPFNHGEPLYSSTNSMSAAVAVGIASSLVLFAQNRMPRGACSRYHTITASCWHYSIQARKLCVVLFYVQPITLIGSGAAYTLMCGVMRWWRCVPGWREGCTHCVDMLMALCIMTLTMANHRGMYLLPLGIQHVFFAEYTALSYLFRQIYLLFLFAYLY